MAGLELITVLALIEYALFGLMVGSARGRFGVAAPATTGEPSFERYFRVQQNTLEALMIFIPALWIFAHRVNYAAAFVLGVVFIAARAEYARGYIASPEGRSLGARVTLAVNGILLLGSVLGLLFYAL
jgi:glutathione S-transferase